ncbi:DUF2309 domain-containing protein [Bremerella cremea]|uniref:Probable inorganic carbon transporter subunit DabA n=1 Tax=Bremerella cremea TaxID=1031537 RepID=A0A368KSP3_9BACT|nr:DUF2309 domain-containing protein [Bremerella cremea]RCS49130.1 DUF2309 domain-containing protein [Bremerella cremea]
MVVALNSLDGSGKKLPTSPLPITQDTFHEFDRTLQRLISVVPPSWPLKDFVAVNPFLGFTGQTLQDTNALLKAVCDVDLLPPLSYFRQRQRDGQLSLDDVMLAYSKLEHVQPNDVDEVSIDEVSIDEINDWLRSDVEPHDPTQRKVWTMAETLDQSNEGERSNQIINDITRCLSVYFDESESVWAIPWRKKSVFAAWKQMNSISYRMDLLGMRGFRQFVQDLPQDTDKAILQMLSSISLPSHLWFAYCLTQLSSILGWASYIKNRSPVELRELLAIRLAYEVFLVQTSGGGVATCFHDDLWNGEASLEEIATPGKMDVIRHILQVACETKFHGGLVSDILRQDDAKEVPNEPLGQFVFCIDVRSEPLRRQLELSSNHIQTFGFAGFFGMPLRNISPNDATGSSHCPVLIKPTFQVEWERSQSSKRHDNYWKWQTRDKENWRSIFTLFRSNPISSLTFVETLGWSSAGKLLSDSLGWVKSRFGNALSDTEPDVLSEPDCCGDHRNALSIEQKVEYCQGFLSNLGLRDHFARFVVVCGHASDVQNNLFQAGLDCGACGGHSGEPNARVASIMLNDPDVRSGLAERGISIPKTTWFVPAVHNTTTERIVLPKLDTIPQEFREDFRELESLCHTASERCAAQRVARFPIEGNQDLESKSRNWGDVRPDWGLVGNAAFVVAPRVRTQGLDLAGRVFLHSYDAAKDPSGKVLELVMTAPMIVTSWINLQYFASTVDNRKYGSGDKLIHNAVGKFGVLEGNGGDLKTGLPIQSIHNGISWQHEPLRLLVIIEAPRDRIEVIIQKHPGVRDLVINGWISLVALEGDRAFCRGFEDWQPYELNRSRMTIQHI